MYRLEIKENSSR